MEYTGRIIPSSKAMRNSNLAQKMFPERNISGGFG
jgi:hypothetical protein